MLTETYRTNRAIVLFIKNEKIRNPKIFSSRIAYDLFNTKIEKLVAQVKDKIDVDIILCSDDPSLIKSNKFIRQTGKSFDEKFNNAIDKTFQLGYDEIIITGNDSPDLTSQHIIESFVNISNEKIVVGPSYDGGIYLLGLAKKSFESKIKARWNTSHVKNDILNVFRDKEVLLLDHLYDIDNEKDLISWFSTKSKSAILFQKLVKAETAVKQKDRLTHHTNSTEQNIFRIHTQKAPPHIISFV